MEAIDLYLLKELHWITLVQQRIQKRYQYLNHAHVMLCFTPFCMMTEKQILQQQLHTANI